MALNMKYLLCGILLLISQLSYADHSHQLEPLEVRYSVFPTTFISDKIATAYRIKRKQCYALMKVSVLNKQQPGKPSLNTKIDGTMLSGLGEKKRLRFRRIQEGYKIYYLAQFKHPPQAEFKFVVNIHHQNKPHQLKFKHTLFSDNEPFSASALLLYPQRLS
ncbi:hypothetical protein PMAL9190_02532 [Photobacterium malacitanum]|uniref:DUF4426 domain-containing protein n=2 Tax=Photobacterium malacitanum TaxID=2204294 RepID=A0A1Y6MLM8_9GAMM|nr:hypothetical protein PMAL9190_02532 [Photobacterium malacitanum]